MPMMEEKHIISWMMAVVHYPKGLCKNHNLYFVEINLLTRHKKP